ncbi:paraquat-inducible protein A [Acidisoma cellulosilytica]|uniref:Paraquat-inducible protein A n=1 Tax=Acidisoma cellulosilyticum TaxID=2802395 RepID=A0A963Z162_9PROT|nr:paraquat-inducible protein A [Acidisoma cellulosilyticum]MCB8879908.1 paraquat-inducible protein A [Acidisoma cellulosilyticum]
MTHWPPSMVTEDAVGDISPSHPIICRYCGLLQQVPALVAPATASCAQCGVTLRRVQRNALGRALAFSLSGLMLLLMSCIMPLMQVSTFGIVLGADMFSGPRRLEDQGVWELALVVLFTTAIAPLLKLAGTAYVLLAIRLPQPPKHARVVFTWMGKLGAWSMVEVYLLGVFVAYVKLVDIVHIDVGVAVFGLVGVMIATVAADAFLDRQAVWETLERKGVVAHRFVPAMVSTPQTGTASFLACETCQKVSRVVGQGGHDCPRCGSHLHARKPNGIVRCWALVMASIVLYIPANLYPVLTVVQMGAGEPSTILGGVEELLAAKMYPLAALVFFASIMVPMLKLVGLIILLLMTQFGSAARLLDRGRLYRIVSVIGRWSMIDIFMISILVALVHFGALVTIEPGLGAVAFAGVVILTIFAAESFDPRMMWDAAASPGERA